MRHNKAQNGFTVVEIIAVLVILGVISAVAVPRYLDMMDEARNRVAFAAVASAQSALSNTYAMLVLQNGNAVNVTLDAVFNSPNIKDNNCGVPSSEFTFPVCAGGMITAQGNGGGTATGTWALP